MQLHRNFLIVLTPPIVVIAIAAALGNVRDDLVAPSNNADGLVFKKVRGVAKGGAVLDVGVPGSFDTWVTCPSLLFDGKLYRMWYSSRYNAKDGPRGIGLATSVDGINWTRANQGKPVFGVGAKGAFDSAQILSPDVVFDGRKYLMWYTGIDGSVNATGLELERIGLAVSSDGVHWKRANGGRPVLELGSVGTCDDVQVAYPSIIREGRSYRMWYSAYAVKFNHTIVAARSQDGITWVRENRGNPVTGLSPAIAYAPSVIRRDGKYLMLYTGWYAQDRSWELGAAVSDDGISWRMLNNSQPMLQRGAADDFDKDNLSHPFMLATNNTLRVWYSGYNRGASGKDPLLIRVGLAEAHGTNW